MEHLTILVSPEGQWVLPGTSEFFAALGDPDPDYDAVSFAVRNLGFIKFEVIRQSIVEIELHPRECRTSGAARGAAAAAVVGSAPVPDQVFRHELAIRDLVLGRGDDRAPVRVVPAALHADRAHERFLVEPQDFGLLFEDEQNAFRVIAQKWRVSFGHFDPNIIPLAMRSQLLPRLAIIGIKPRQRIRCGALSATGMRWMGEEYVAQDDRREGRRHSGQGLRRMGQRLLPLGRRIRAGRATIWSAPRCSTATRPASRGGRSATRGCCCPGKRRRRKFS